jgi:predicted polyphosphate/ATP-dependent NAD kinase
VASVGVVVNPWAGKDIRRLHAPVGHTPDTAKVGVVRRVVIAALEAGADHVMLARDVGRIAERASTGIEPAVLVDGPGTGSALDSRRGAAQLVGLGCRPIVVLGGDGTCRDVAIGAPETSMVAISTGTNNVFPVFVDGSSAGTAAGLIAAGKIDAAATTRRSKLLTITIEAPGVAPVEEVALVDVALVDATRTGARAVVRAEAVRLVVATIATPMSTGLSSIAGRVAPLGRSDDGAVVVRLGGASARRVRVPIVPGTFDELAVESVELLADGESITFQGPGVLAYDGERDRVLAPGSTITVRVSRTGPAVVDVDLALHCAARQRLFDVTSPIITPEAPHGD